MRTAKKVLYFFNSGGAVSTGLSGGDVRFIEVTKRLKMHRAISTTSGGLQACKKENLRSDFYLMPTYPFNEERTKWDRIISLIITTILSPFKSYRLPFFDIAYTTSDIVSDVVPAFFYKRRHLETKWIAMIHHRYDVPWRRRGDPVMNCLGFLSQRLSFELIRNYADAIFVYRSPEGKAIKEYFVKEGFSGNIFEVENGIDLDLLSQIIPEKQDIDACFAAGLRENKGIFDLIEIWRLVSEKRKNAKLVIIGSGRQELISKMRDLIAKYKLSNNIEFTGFIPHGEELFRVIKRCKVFISPSYEEGWGIAVCEAMGCGLPVVAWDLPIYKGLFPQGMITVSIKNIDEFADNVIALLKNHKLLKKIRKDALKVASKYNWDIIAERELELMKLIAK